MELAFHLKNPEQKNMRDTFPQDLSKFYPKNCFENSFSDCQFPESYNRIYIGNEFCLHRIPVLNQLKEFCRFARDRKLKITLLTPVMTDKGLEKTAPLFDYLAKDCSKAEVVVNDWGLLLFLKKNYPKFVLGAGRLLNKGFKDPRLKKQDNVFTSQNNFLRDSTFQNHGFQEKIIKLGISCLEQDLLPYSDSTQLTELKNNPNLKYSFYFPFGYITTGRTCLTATLNQSANQRFIPPAKCSGPCNERSFQLESKDFSFRIFQNGNTLFYLYKLSVLNSLIENAKYKKIRLVYQGFIM